MLRRIHSSDGRAGAWVAAGLASIFVAAGLAVGRVAFQPDRARTGGTLRPGTMAAPDFAGIRRWINSPALSIESLRGKVVLVDFWTFSCINCVRTIPTLRALYERYRPFGLEIVGVHSPEFGFEKDPGNVADATRRLKVTWPVAMDNDLDTWHAYRNQYWPHVYMLDRTGLIRYDHIGEGDEAEQEAQLRALLAEGNRPLPAPVSPEEPSFDPHLTPEVYLGRERGLPAGTIANDEGYRGLQEVDYRAPSQETLDAAAPDGRVFLAGRWQPGDELIRAKGRARLFLPFNARTVFMVAESAPETGVQLLLDGVLVGSGAADAPGGIVRVARSDLYALVVLPKTERHVLILDVEPGFALYTFTFG